MNISKTQKLFQQEEKKCHPIYLEMVDVGYVLLCVR